MYEIIKWPGDQWRTIRKYEDCESGDTYEIHRGLEKARMQLIHIPADPSEIEMKLDEGISPNRLSRFYAEQANGIETKLKRIMALKDNEHLLLFDEYKIIQDSNEISWTIFLRSQILPSAKDWFEMHLFDEKKFLHFCENVFNALEICHASGILHGNLAPQNIFVNQNEDFLLGNLEIDPYLKKNRPMEYRPPEVEEGDAYSGSEEMYALGFLFYTIMNRMRSPFMPVYMRPLPEDVKRAVKSLRQGRTIPEPVYGSREIRQAVRKAISFRPEDRFANIEEFRRALGLKKDDDDTDRITTSAANVLKTVDIHWNDTAKPETENPAVKKMDADGHSSYEDILDEEEEENDPYADIMSFKRNKSLRLERNKEQYVSPQKQYHWVIMSAIFLFLLIFTAIVSF